MAQVSHSLPYPAHIQIVNTTMAHLPDLAYFQRMIYPTLTENERYTISKYHHHLMLFPEGQFVAIGSMNGEEKVVGSTSTFRIQFDFNHTQHSFQDISAGGWLTNS